MIRKQALEIGEYYHIYSRGVNKMPIFNLSSDYARFVSLLYLANGSKSINYRDLTRNKNFDIYEFGKGESLVSIGAYCLMPNHFHILLKEIKENGITEFMQRFLTSYSKYFNLKNDRTGTLFESRFQASHVGSDEYLKYLFSYVHLNPVKIIDPNWKERGLADLLATDRFLKSYRFSSYPDYLGEERIEARILSTEDFPEYFSDGKEFKDFIEDWLKYKDIYSIEKIALSPASGKKVIHSFL